jgi:hypothetical protein
LINQPERKNVIKKFRAVDKILKAFKNRYADLVVYIMIGGIRV